MKNWTRNRKLWNQKTVDVAMHHTVMRKWVLRKPTMQATVEGMSMVVGNEDGLQTSKSLPSEWLRSLEVGTGEGRGTCGSSPFSVETFRHVITSPIPRRANLNAMPTVLEQWGQLWCEPSHVSTHNWHPITRSHQGATTGSVLTSLQITQLNACWRCVRKFVTLCTPSTPFATFFSLVNTDEHRQDSTTLGRFGEGGATVLPLLLSLSPSVRSMVTFSGDDFPVNFILLRLAASTLRVDFQNLVPWAFSSSRGKHLLSKRMTSNDSWSFISATVFKVHLLSSRLT